MRSASWLRCRGCVNGSDECGCPGVERFGDVGRGDLGMEHFIARGREGRSVLLIL